MRNLKSRLALGLGGALAAVLAMGTVMAPVAEAAPPTAEVTITKNNVWPKPYLTAKGHVDHVVIGNTLSKSEDRSNCGKLPSSSADLDLPAGATVLYAELEWSYSGYTADRNVTLNGTTVTSETNGMYYLPYDYYYQNYATWRAQTADVTKLVQGNDTYTFKDLAWSNAAQFCQINAAYGSWALTVVYEDSNVPLGTVNLYGHSLKRTTYPTNGTVTVNLSGLPAQECATKARLTTTWYEGDQYKSEYSYVNGKYVGANLLNGSSGPNLDIRSFAFNVNKGQTTTSFQVYAWAQNTKWGYAFELALTNTAAITVRDADCGGSGSNSNSSNG